MMTASRLTARPCFVIIAALTITAAAGARATDTLATTSSPSFDISHVRISGQWFFAYVDREKPGFADRAFLLKRGYLTFESPLVPSLLVRITQDVSVDQEGDGEGDIEIRLKYGYLRYTISELGPLFHPFFEFGVVHRPWIDFEESINGYRIQGTMFLERNDMLRSADYGICFGSLLGGEMDEGYRKTVNRHYAGRYGSVMLGVFNGGGYEALEKNNNKLMEGRVTLRPFPESVPGFQVSGLAGIGKGNTPSAPDYSFLGSFLSFEDRAVALTAQYFSGTGDVNGAVIDSAGTSLRQNGYSVFLRAQVLTGYCEILGRFDNIAKRSAVTSWMELRSMVGISLSFAQQLKILVSYEYLDIRLPKPDNSWVFEVAMEFVF